MAQSRNVLTPSEKIKATLRFLEGLPISTVAIRFSTNPQVISDKIRETLLIATSGTAVKLPSPLVLQSVTRSENGEKKYVTARDMAAVLLPLVRELEKQAGNNLCRPVMANN